MEEYSGERKQDMQSQRQEWSHALQSFIQQVFIRCILQARRCARKNSLTFLSAYYVAGSKYFSYSSSGSTNNPVRLLWWWAHLTDEEMEVSKEWLVIQSGSSILFQQKQMKLERWVEPVLDGLADRRGRGLTAGLVHLPYWLNLIFMSFSSTKESRICR